MSTQRNGWPNLPRQVEPSVVEALEYLRGAWLGADGKLEALRHELAELRREVLGELRKRPTTSALARYNPEQTIGGGVRLESQAWQDLQGQIAELSELAETAKREALVSKAREDGARSALEQLEERQEKRRKAVTFWLAVLGAGGAFVGWLAAHVLHL